MPTIDPAVAARPSSQYNPTVSRDPRVNIGVPDQPVRALAFAGGVFDAAMQLGTAHALLVSNSAPPDVVVGISSGAINAVAVAEILQAGNPSDSDEAQIEARVARFREVLEAYRQSPEDVLAAFIPDFYQIDAESPLKPTELPIYYAQERDERFRAARSRLGLIKLTNDLLKLDVSIGSITRVVRALLGKRAVVEISPWKRYPAKALELWHLWRVLASNIFALAPIGVRLVEFAVAPHADRLSDWARCSPVLRSFLRAVAKPIPRVTGDQLIKRIVKLISRWGNFGGGGRSAGALLFRGAIRKNAGKTLQWVSGFVIMLLLISTPMILVGSGAVLFALAVSERAREALVTLHLLLIHATNLQSSSRSLTAFEWWALGAVGLAILIVVYVPDWLAPDRILRFYGIADALFDPYPLKSWFVRLFDPKYYGKSGMDSIVEAALTTQRPDDSAASGAQAVARTPKVLSDYATYPSPIHVGPMAADVQTGKLKVLPSETPVVDALLAATARPPIFEAQQCGETWWIDGTVVANQPTRALITHITPLVNADATAVHVYPVGSLPLGASELGVQSAEYSGLVASTRRALTLQSFRDATLDRRLTDLVSRCLPGNRAAWWPGRELNEPRGTEQFLRASVYPIELDSVASLNERLIGARSVAKRRELIVESVAEGCRLTLEVLLHERLVGSGQGAVACRSIIEGRLGERSALPGSPTSGGPGLPEVCRACALHSADRDPAKRIDHSLRVPTSSRELPLWPVATEQSTSLPPQAEAEQCTDAERQVLVEVPSEDESPSARLHATMSWPTTRGDQEAAGETRPTISLLFSGGVFRGVYLAGVINALNEVGAQPDAIAGSSIGSITAAMAARLFATPAGDGSERRRRIQRIAATYLAVDRLVMTDRFSDFIRNFTLRAGATGFSLRDLDTSFRIFDRSKSDAYGCAMRKVLAGLERLFYVSPFEARDLVHAFRMRQYDEAVILLSAYAQEWLERGAVGLEILGSEPLEMLIREHVLNGTQMDGSDPAAGFVNLIKQNGIQFIATATNLTRGRLDQLHIPPTSLTKKTRLVEALLASSAFPAVFRPRFTWEVAPQTNVVEQYIDGGVMDNLPLDAVARFLDDCRKVGAVAPRPSLKGEDVPHLLFTASLEVERPMLSKEATNYTARRWMEAMRRAKELTYNNKIDNYAQTQRHLRNIWQRDDRPRADRPFVPLDLEVVAVKPSWLCGTFAFHPMLGFRRSDQARSIAHGCKSTLKTIHDLNNTRPSWIAGWKITPPKEWSDIPNKSNRSKGECWYRTGCVCPFSKQGIEAAGAPALAPNTQDAVEQIYLLCRKKKTHARRDPNPVLNPDDSSITSLSL